jgi:hypothetical protein
MSGGCRSGTRSVGNYIVGPTSGQSHGVQLKIENRDLMSAG